MLGALVNVIKTTVSMRKNTSPISPTSPHLADNRVSVPNDSASEISSATRLFSLLSRSERAAITITTTQVICIQVAVWLNELAASIIRYPILMKSIETFGDLEIRSSPMK
jgi:hypothetical protein